jgi:hypothetical protein
MKSAERDYLELEKATADDPQKNVVLVSVSSLHALHKAYPNYYVDSSKFIKSA